MNTYQITTTTTMKEYNRKRFWIDADIIRPVTVKAESVSQALRKYQQIVADKFYITISDNALKTKQPIYTDTPTSYAQVGYIITGIASIDNGQRYVEQYVDLWAKIQIVVNPFEVASDD